MKNETRNILMIAAIVLLTSGTIGCAVVTMVFGFTHHMHSGWLIAGFVTSVIGYALGEIVTKIK